MAWDDSWAINGLQLAHGGGSSPRWNKGGGKKGWKKQRVADPWEETYAGQGEGRSEGWAWVPGIPSQSACRRRHGGDIPWISGKSWLLRQLPPWQPSLHQPPAVGARAAAPSARPPRYPKALPTPSAATSSAATAAVSSMACAAPRSSSQGALATAATQLRGELEGILGEDPVVQALQTPTSAQISKAFKAATNDLRQLGQKKLVFQSKIDKTKDLLAMQIRQMQALQNQTACAQAKVEHTSKQYWVQVLQIAALNLAGGIIQEVLGTVGSSLSEEQRLRLLQLAGENREEKRRRKDLTEEKPEKNEEEMETSPDPDDVLPGSAAAGGEQEL